MAKRDTIHPAKTYVIRQFGINGELLFPETENKRYFEKLMAYHVTKVGKIVFYIINPHSVQFVVEIKPRNEIAQQYRDKLHQPFSNLFNAYSKAYNKYKSRTGSLFVRNYERKILWTPEQLRSEITRLLESESQRSGLR